MIVVDASALFDVLRRSSTATASESRLLGSGLTLQGPHLLDIELAHVVGRHAAGSEIAPDRAQEVLADLVALPSQRHLHDWLLPRAWELRHNLSAYDTIYVALAEALDAPLCHPRQAPLRCTGPSGAGRGDVMPARRCRRRARIVGTLAPG